MEGTGGVAVAEVIAALGRSCPNSSRGVPEELVWLRNLTQKKWAEPEHSNNNFMAKSRGPEE